MSVPENEVFTIPLGASSSPVVRPLGAGGARLAFEGLPPGPAGLPETELESEARLNPPEYPTGMGEKLDAMMAGFQMQHSLASYLADPTRPGDFPDDGHEPNFLELEEAGYDSSQFVNVRSKAHEDWLKGSIEAERQRRRLSDSSGSGWVGQAMGALSDPFMAMATILSGGGTAGLRAIVMAEVAGAVATETALQLTQHERSMLETTLNVAASGIVTGLIGKTGMVMGEEWVRAKTHLLVRDQMKSLFGEKVDDALVEQMTKEAMDSVGAMRAAGQGNLESEGLVGGKAIEMMTFGPMGRLLQGSTIAGRKLAVRLADSSFMQGRHLGRGTADGEVIANPISAEGVHRDDMARVFRSIDNQDRLYQQYRKRVNAAGSRVPVVGGMLGAVADTVRRPGAYLNDKDFGIAVANAMRNGDAHAIPEVAETARFWREHGMKDVYERALRTGELVDDYTHAMNSMYRSYEKRFDADVDRHAKGVDSITEAFFKAFQKGLDDASRGAQEADLDTFRLWQDEVRKAEAAGTAPPTAGAATEQAVERGASSSPWMTVKARKEVSRSIRQYLEEHGFEEMADPAAYRALIKHIEELHAGRLVAPDTGPNLGQGQSKLARAVETETRKALRSMDEIEFKGEIDLAFGALDDEYRRLMQIADEPLDARGLPGRGRLSRQEFEDAMDRVWRDDYADTDLSQVERLRGAKTSWQRKQARRKGRTETDVPPWEEMGLPARGVIYHPTSQSYFPRIVDEVAMDRNSEGLRAAIDRYLVEQGGTEVQAAQAAEDIVNAYLSHGRNDLPFAVELVGQAGFAKARRVNIPDNVLAPWMVNDPAVAIRGWSRSLGMRSHFVEEFGDREMAGVMEELNTEYLDLINAAAREKPDPDSFASAAAYDAAEADWKKAAKETTRLNSEWGQTRRDLHALQQRLVGQYGRAESYDRTLEKVFEKVRLFNMLSMLGGAAFSSITDIARPIQAYGLRPFAQGLGKLIRELPRRHQDLKDLGVGLVYAQNSRMAMLSDVDLTTLGGTERAVGTWFLNASGITTWDTFIQRTAGYTAIAGLERMTKNWSSLAAKQKARLARAGIGDNEAKVIARAFEQYGPEISAWPMPAVAKNVVRKAIQSDVDQISFKPLIGDQLLMMSGPTGKTLLQFKQFVLNAHNRMLVAGIQQNDVNFYMGFLTSALVGATVAEGKSRLRGKGSILDHEGGVTYAAVESMGRAGWFGMYEPFKDLGLISGGWKPSRFAAQNLMGAVGGPTWNQMQRAGGVIVSGLSPDGQITYDQMAPLVPILNTMHLRDIAERVASAGQ